MYTMPYLDNTPLREQACLRIGEQGSEVTEVIINSTTMTNSECRQQCASRGHNFASVQFVQVRVHQGPQLRFRVVCAFRDHSFAFVQLMQASVYPQIHSFASIQFVQISVHPGVTALLL